MAADFTNSVIDTWPTSHGFNEKQAESMAGINQKILSDIRGFSLMFSVPTADMPLVDTTHTSIWVEDAQQFISDYGKEARMALEAAKDDDDDPSMAKISVSDAKVGDVNAVVVDRRFFQAFKRAGGQPTSPTCEESFRRYRNRHDLCRCCR